MPIKLQITSEIASPPEYIRQALKHFNLVVELALRDVRSRYSRNLLGMLWLVLQPMAYLVGLAFIFGRLKGGLRGEAELEQWLIVGSGLTAWHFFSLTVTQAGRSIREAADIVKKVYFPSIVLPWAKTLVGLVDLLVVLVLTFGLLIYQNALSYRLLFLPVLILGFIVFVSFTAALVSMITARFKDFQHLYPFGLQIGLFLSPVAYRSESLTGPMASPLRYLYYCNPLAGFIDLFRWCLLGDPVHNPALVLVSLVFAVFIVLACFFLFPRMEANLADQL